MRYLLLLFLFSCIQIVYSHCNLLSLSGGGSFGAVEAGILDSLVSRYQVPSRFDVITGISAGGLNAGFLYHFENVTTGLPPLKKLFSTLQTSDIYESDIIGIFKRWSIYNNAPLEKTLVNVLGNLNQTTKPPIVLIGASNILTEHLDVFSFGTFTFQEKIDLLMSTSAIPLIFPPRSFQNGLYVDGGVISNEMITQAIGEIECKFYNITFISASSKHAAENQVDGLMSYLSAVVHMISRTFDYQLAQSSTCTYPKGQINACFPTSTELNKYSILDFNHGLELYELGKNSNECTVYELC